jgi:hypothetical protein
MWRRVVDTAYVCPLARIKANLSHLRNALRAYGFSWEAEDPLQRKRGNRLDSTACWAILAIPVHEMDVDFACDGHAVYRIFAAVSGTLPLI